MIFCILASSTCLAFGLKMLWYDKTNGIILIVFGILFSLESFGFTK